MGLIDGNMKKVGNFSGNFLLILEIEQTKFTVIPRGAEKVVFDSTCLRMRDLGIF